MAPVVCDFDLMSRLAALTVDDKYELFEGDEQQRRPSIVVTPCTGEAKAGGGIGDGLMTGKTARAASPGNDTDNSSDSELPVRPKIPLPHTPRPPRDNWPGCKMMDQHDPNFGIFTTVYPFIFTYILSSLFFFFFFAEFLLIEPIFWKPLPQMKASQPIVLNKQCYLQHTIIYIYTDDFLRRIND